MARTKQFADDEVVTSVIGFVDCSDGPGFVAVAVGQRLRADNPIVRRHPDWFVPDGSDSLAITRARQAIETADLEPAPSLPPELRTRIVQPLRDQDALVCIAGSAAGQRVHRRSKAAKARPDLYVPVVTDPALTRETAYVALQTMIIYEDGTPARTVHQGQWVARDDALVRIHPTMFELPPYVDDERMQ